jgi:adenylosuccinate synthase
MLKLVALGFWRESVLRDWVRCEGRGRRVGAMQVSQALNSSNISNYVTSITLLKVEWPNLDNIWECVQNFVDGRVRGVLIKGPQKSEVQALQLQDDINALERVSIVSRCTRAEQVARVWLRTRAPDS